VHLRKVYLNLGGGVVQLNSAVSGRSGLFAERWNGLGWSAPTYLALRGATYAILNSVECRSASNCYAVGTVTRDWGVKYGIVVEHWDGKAWKVVSVPAPKDDVYGGLSSIACASARACIAVGGGRNRSR
jgi:hypothetical protein